MRFAPRAKFMYLLVPFFDLGFGFIGTDEWFASFIELTPKSSVMFCPILYKAPPLNFVILLPS